tara:strand:- start:116 stop:706 length:591 start_codon:yes stop_codon:yes gene_type:complete
MSKYSATQQANFTKNSDPQQGISLCIPRVFNNIGWRRIKKHIIEANLGYVERIDVVPVAEGKYKRAFVHFAPGKWNMRDATARDALKALQEGNKIKLEYESPWYWLVGISGAARPAEAPKPRERKTRVELKVPSSAAELVMSGDYKSSNQPDAENHPAPKPNSPDMNDPVVARAMEGASIVVTKEEEKEAEISYER